MYTLCVISVYISLGLQTHIPCTSNEFSFSGTFTMAAVLVQTLTVMLMCSWKCRWKLRRLFVFAGTTITALVSNKYNTYSFAGSKASAVTALHVHSMQSSYLLCMCGLCINLLSLCMCTLCNFCGFAPAVCVITISSEHLALHVRQMDWALPLMASTSCGLWLAYQSCDFVMVLQCMSLAYSSSIWCFDCCCSGWYIAQTLGLVGATMHWVSSSWLWVAWHLWLLSSSSAAIISTRSAGHLLTHQICRGTSKRGTDQFCVIVIVYAPLSTPKYMYMFACFVRNSR